MLDSATDLLCHVLLRREWGECVKGWKPFPADFSWTELLLMLVGGLACLAASFALILSVLYLTVCFFDKPSRNVVLTTSYGCIVCCFSITVAMFMVLYGEYYFAPSTTIIVSSMIAAAFLWTIHAANPLISFGKKSSRSTDNTQFLSCIVCLAVFITILQFYPQRVVSRCNFLTLSLIFVWLCMCTVPAAACIHFTIIIFEIWTAEKLDFFGRDGKKAGYLVKKEGEWIEYKLDDSGVEQQGLIKV